MPQWTPGPWEVTRRALVTIEAPAHCGPIAYMANRLDLPVSDSMVQATQEANARLIAAAPEMADLLRRMHAHGCFDRLSVEFDHEARALLARLNA